MADTAGRRSEYEEKQFMILQMVQDGTISSDEGARLLEAMSRVSRMEAPPAPPTPPKAANIHIVITNQDGEKEMDFTLPIGLVEVGLNFANKVAPGRVPELPEVRSAIRSGFRGKLIDFNQGKDRIEISIE